MPKEINDHTYTNWVVQGGGGWVSMLEALCEGTAPVSEATYAQLREYSRRVIRCLALLEEKNGYE